MNASFPAGAAAATPPLAVARALELRHGSHVAVRHSDFTLPARRLIAVIGPNGSGKTTLMRMVNRLVEPTAGIVRIDGRETTSIPPYELRRHIGYAIQNHASLDEAKAGAVWLLELHKEHWPEWEGEIEIRQMFGPEDF